MKLTQRLVKAWRTLTAKAPAQRRARLGYDGAKSSRLQYDWLTGNGGPNSEIGNGLRRLRDRCRDLSRNNPHGAKAVEALVSNIVPTGIRARWSDPRTQALWDTWIDQCSVGDELDLYGLQSLAVRAMIEGGDSLIRRRARRLDDGLAVPLQLEVLEGDQLDDSKTGAGSVAGGRIVQGVEFDPIGRRRAYHLFRSHPGDMSVWLNTLAETVAIPAADVAHLCRVTRPGQVRSVSWLATVILALRDIGEYTAAERTRKRSQAGLVGVLTPADDATYSDDTDSVGAAVVDSDGDVVDELQPGQVLVARNGKNFTFSNPASDSGFADFMRIQLQTVGSGVFLPYEILTSDLSQVNYSSIRLGLVEFQRFVKVAQTQIVIPLMMRPIARWFIEAGQAAGTISATNPPTVRWVLPEREEIDRETAVKSAILAIRAGLISRRDQVQASGGDADEVLTEIAEDLAALDRLGITLDTDPRHGSDGPTAPPQEATP